MTEPKPDTLNHTKTADGVQIALLKPPLYRRSRSDLAKAICFSLVFFLVMVSAPVAMTVFTGNPHVTVLFPVVGCFTALMVLSSEVNWERESAVLEIAMGFLTFFRSGSDVPKQWPLGEVRSVRAWYLGLLWELQIELKSGEIVRVLKGRSRRELQLAASLLRSVLAGPAPAARPVEAPALTSSGGECQVCGAGMNDHVVYCAKCRTPHHEECWVYNGACSTYGCREIRSTRTA
jgi:hypothetical protein